MTRTACLAASLLFALLAFAASPALAGEDDEISLTGSLAGHRFLAAEEIRIQSAQGGDLFVAGGEVRFDQVAIEDLFAAAGDMTLRGLEAQDAVLAAGQLVIDARLSEDLIAAAGNLRLDPGSVVVGDAVLAAGNLELDGKIAGALTAAAGHVTITGEIAGDADIAARRITLAPGARIGGVLRYRSNDPPDIAADAVVAGGVEQIGLLGGRHLWGGLIAFGLFGFAALTVGLILLAAVLHAALPRLLEIAADTITERPLVSLCLGFALAVGLPAAALLFMATLIGLPLGFLVLALFAVLLAGAEVVAGHWLGLRVRAWLRLPGAPLSVPRRFGWTVLGLLLLALLFLIPVIGTVLVGIAVLLGLGALAVPAWFALRKPSPSALP